MDTNTFVRTVTGNAPDRVERMLQQVSEYTISIVFGLLPLIFIPVAFLPLDYGKMIITIGALALAVLFFSLSVLRSGSLTFGYTPPVIGLWAVAGIGALSALFSGDLSDAFIGDLFEVNTAVFLVLLALVGSLSSLIKLSKMSIMRLYILLTGSAALLGIFHVLRLVFGPEFLALGMFERAASSTVGSWNDLGLFFGLSVLLSLVALEQLPLTRWGRVVFTVGIALSLVMLGVINFSAVWWVLGLVSLVMLMYSLVKDRFANSLAKDEAPTSSLQSILISLAVFISSMVFIVAGGPLGGLLSDATGVSYLEVRPSFVATTDIARSVYSENAFFGIGPNKFVDAWRLYKDPAINQTIFWNTDFRGGNGYITTFMVTTGILGILAWLLFLGLFFYAGFRMLFKSVHADRFWYFIGSSSFAAASYLWVMSVIYLPGTTILILAALFTTITLAAYMEILGARRLTVSVRQNKRAAILLVGVVMVVVVGAASILYFTGRHATAVYTYGETLTNATPGTTLAQVEQGIARAYDLFPNDSYARQLASYQLTKINSLLQISEPSETQQQEFQDAVVNGINSAQRAVEMDPTDAQNWSILGRIYSVLVAAGETEVSERAAEAFANARRYAPHNPTYVLQEAQLQVRVENTERGRELVDEAIALKPNYTDALNFLTELEVALGRTEEAVAATRSVISIEPNNPARHYQLAILLSTQNDIDGAIASLERAVSLNRNYANARYLLGLAYAEQGRMDEAIAQLEVVQELNPDNENVRSLIGQMESGSYEPNAATTTETISEPETVTQEEDSVTASEAPDTPLVSPVNTVPESTDDTDDVSTSEAQPFSDAAAEAVETDNTSE